MKVFDINNSYFKYQKCFSGITYQFVNNLDNIYEKNLMVGTNYCIYCMYSEFDIINNFMNNICYVDVCSTENLDLSKRYYKIDNASLRTGHKVLLVNQDDPMENDIYVVDSRGFLILSNDLSNSTKNWRHVSYIKLGNNKGKQFFLKNSGNRFPLTGERKYFLEGHGYIIKNTFNYDLFDTGPIVPKLIFTDYELARLSVNKNYILYDGFNLPSYSLGDTVNIQYHENDYIITIDDDTTKYTYTGITSGNTIFNLNNFPTDGYGIETHVKVDSSFCANSSVYDYIKISISGDTNLYLKTFIKNIGVDEITISDYIPDNILYEYYTGNTSIYTVTNLMYSELSNINNIILESYLSKYFSINSGYLYPIENINNKYFDYDGLKFIFNTTECQFSTYNHYIKYRLYDLLNQINSYVFDLNYSFLIDYSFNNSSFVMEYYDEYPNTTIYPTTLGDTKGTLIKIIPNRPTDTNYFRNYTYVNLVTNSGRYKTLIVDLVPNEYFVIETYKSDSGLTFSNFSIETIYNLKEISDILYDVYINDETSSNTDYYRIRNDNTRRSICNCYAEFISQDLEIITYTTAFLMLDDKNKFILKIYDPENSYNGGVKRLPYVVTKLGATSTATSAVLPGEVINDGGVNIRERGLCWSKTSLLDLCTSASTVGIGPYTVNATNLSPLSTYYYRAYAINDQGTSYGVIYSFLTQSPLYNIPTVRINNVTTYSHSITIDAEVIDDGYSTITDRGIVYNTGTSTPTISERVFVSLPEPGTIGPFSCNITGLTHSQIYSYNSFAINVICGITYGESGTTETLFPYPPVVTTNYTPNITYNSVDVLCELVSNDGSTNDPIHGVDYLGVVYSTDILNLPTTGDTILLNSPYPFSIGSYTMYVTGLTHETNYHFRAFAMNTLYSGDTTSYGQSLLGTTSSLPVAPTVTISSVPYIHTYNAYVNNTIVSNGGSPITSKGIYYSTGNTVTVYDTFLYATGTTTWTSILTGLTPMTDYSIMAEVTNDFGTGRSSMTGFTTLPMLFPPTVTLSYISTTSTGTTLSGNVTNNGNATILARGIIYSGVTTGGWLTLSYTPDTGIWNSNITGLTNSNTYYAKAYAINMTGTSYSDIVTWSTTSGNFPPSFSIDSPSISSISDTTSYVTNNILSNGGASVTSRGIIYSGATTLTWLNWYGGTGSGIWNTQITGLTQGNIYYVYAYATNSEGTTNTSIVSFTTETQVVPTVVTNSISNITTTTATINSDVTSDGFSTVTDRGITGDTISIWQYPTGGVGTYSITLTGLTQNSSYTGQSYAINSIGTANSIDFSFTTLTFNNTEVQMSILSDLRIDNPYVYQVGETIDDIYTSVVINNNNVPAEQLWSGLTSFSFDGNTGLTWGLGVTTAINSTPYTYLPTGVEDQTFYALESCGTPSEIKMDESKVDAIYPFLTCNRIPAPGSPIPNITTLASWCNGGQFYTGNFPNGYEPMLKKIETFSNKTYQYSIGTYDNLIYFAYPYNYGKLKSYPDGIKVNGTPISFTEFTNLDMNQYILTLPWSGVKYNVYAFTVPSRSGDIDVTYEF